MGPVPVISSWSERQIHILKSFYNLRTIIGSSTLNWLIKKTRGKFTFIINFISEKKIFNSKNLRNIHSYMGSLFLLNKFSSRNVCINNFPLIVTQMCRVYFCITSICWFAWKAVTQAMSYFPMPAWQEKHWDSDKSMRKWLIFSNIA